MKRYILMIIVLVSMLTLSGCNEDRVNFTYSDKQEIQVENSEVETVARIMVVDTYTKNNIKYYVIQTNISSDKEWTLSETEYDEFIGLGNDAVDCTIYSLHCSSKILDYSYSVFADNDLQNHDFSSIADELKGLDLLDYFNPFIIKEACGKEFESDECRLSRYDYDGNKSYVTSRIKLKRYSFIGETAFTEEEISEYVDIMHMVSSEYATRLRELIK